MSNLGSCKIRKKVKYNSPNRLFEQWLTEWKDEAASKGKKSQHTFARALKSLRKYPLPLASGKEAKILEHFGDKICAMLDERLQQHKSSSSSNGSETCSAQVNNILPSPSKTNKRINSVKAKSSAIPKKSALLPSSVIMPSSSIKISTAINSKEFDVCEPAKMSANTIYLTPGTYEIVLCVDSCETLSSHSANKKLFLSELKKSGIHFEIRKLNVGDFLWIARTRGNSNPKEELVMDFIVERKRMDDLSHSIKDGRFREQKFRLRNCGLRYPVYLVEYHGSHKHSGIPESTLEQAIVNTQIVDGFIIRRTQNTKESVSYLLSVTRYLQNSLQMQSLTSGSSHSGGYLSFEEFNHSSVKNKCLTIQEMFAKQLLQFHGLSVDRASAFVSLYPTLTRLFEVLDACESETEKLKSLSEIKFGKSMRNIGTSLGKNLLQFYSTCGPLS